jgi:hypothetical protein
MPAPRLIRHLLACLLPCGLICSVLYAQLAPTGQPKPSAGIPATEPTVAPPAPPLTPGQRPAHHATVVWQAGQLTVTADNSSLNQILREVSRQTGMQITGGVVDERVFGVYGPGDPTTILDALLDGTGSNMLLLLNDADAPATLVLTPRHGGASPPSPNAVAHDADEDLPPQQIRPISRRAEAPAALNAINPPPSPQPGAPVVAQPAQSSAPPPAAAAADSATTTQQSPNGVKTPQQIFEQLMKLQQQQKAPGSTTPQ